MLDYIDTLFQTPDIQLEVVSLQAKTILIDYLLKAENNLAIRFHVHIKAVPQHFNAIAEIQHVISDIRILSRTRTLIPR